MTHDCLLNTQRERQRYRELDREREREWHKQQIDLSPVIIYKVLMERQKVNLGGKVDVL